MCRCSSNRPGFPDHDRGRSSGSRCCAPSTAPAAKRRQSNAFCRQHPAWRRTHGTGSIHSSLLLPGHLCRFLPGPKPTKRSRQGRPSPDVRSETADMLQGMNPTREGQRMTNGAASSVPRASMSPPNVLPPDRFSIQRPNAPTPQRINASTHQRSNALTREIKILNPKSTIDNPQLTIPKVSSFNVSTQ